MVQKIMISLWWILDNLIRVLRDNKIQCVSVNMSWLGDMLLNINRLQEIKQLERVRGIKNINKPAQVSNTGF